MEGCSKDPTGQGGKGDRRRPAAASTGSLYSIAGLEDAYCFQTHLGRLLHRRHTAAVSSNSNDTIEAPLLPEFSSTVSSHIRRNDCTMTLNSELSIMLAAAESG
uniref:Uncharacterized protein n=1 Tax=Lutzomyia longipalpis TaxID=7200 RepID=A0A1B0CAV6_LUTLO